MNCLWVYTVERSGVNLGFETVLESQSLVWEFHEEKVITYNLRIQNLCKLPTIKTLSFGLNSLSFRGSFLRNTLDDSIKQEPTKSRLKIGSKVGLQMDSPVKYVDN